MKKNLMKIILVSACLFSLSHLHAQFNFGPLADQSADEDIRGDLEGEEDPGQFNFGP